MGVEPLTPQELAQIRKHVKSYAVADNRKGLEVALSTAIAVVLSIVAYPMCQHLFSGWLFGLAMAACVLFRGMAIARCFILFHDCAHEATFESKFLNQWVGKLAGGMASTDYFFYRKHHLDHHQLVSTNEDAISKDIQGTIFWTNRQWEHWTTYQRIWLRIARDPVVYIFGTAFYLAVTEGLITCFTHRLRPDYVASEPNVKPTVWKWLAIAELVCGVILFGPGYALYALGGAWVASAIGITIVSLEHTVDGPAYYGVKQAAFNPVQATIEGSTLIDFPEWLSAWFLHVAYHHIHHLNDRVPCYNLKRCHDDLEPRLWRTVPRIGLKSGLGYLLTVQYNPDKGTLEPFTEYSRLHRLLS